MTTSTKPDTRERRSLLEGLKASPTIDRTLEEAFVFSGKTKESAPLTSPVAEEPVRETKAMALGRVPLTTRMRADYAAALKRASLERQLSGTFPNTLQDILEQSLEPWLRANGYLA